MSLLPDGWDRDVGDDAWPDALVSAIKVDVGALASPRAIATLRAWRASIRGSEPQRAIALLRLAQVADALSAPGGPIPTERLDTLALRGPGGRGASPPMRGASPPVRGASPPLDQETDSAVSALARDPSRPPEHTVWAYGEPGWVPVDDAPDIDPLLAELAGQRPPTIDLDADEDERTGETADARKPVLRASTQLPPSLDFIDEPPTAANLISPRKGSIAPASKPAPPPLPPASYVGRKPSIPRSPTRPRASLIQVRSLFAAVGPLVKLVPLTYERRSRRFWTHWREVSGERGVHREAAERILENARDFHTLVTELIAEVLDVDLESVRVLVERIEAEEPPGASGPRATEERARGPLVGASVRVSGLPPTEDD